MQERTFRIHRWSVLAYEGIHNAPLPEMWLKTVLFRRTLKMFRRTKFRLISETPCQSGSDERKMSTKSRRSSENEQFENEVPVWLLWAHLEGAPKTTDFFNPPFSEFRRDVMLVVVPLKAQWCEFSENIILGSDGTVSCVRRNFIWMVFLHAAFGWNYKMFASRPI